MLPEIISGLFELIGPLAEASTSRRELKDEALRAIMVALNETEFYYKRLEDKNNRSRDTEQKLSNYWATAAIFIRHFDQHLAEICQYKSEFWRNYENWTPEMIKKTGIELENVQKEYKRMLLPKHIPIQYKKYSIAEPPKRRRLLENKKKK